jgi:flagellar biosynthesis protein FlhG
VNDHVITVAPAQRRVGGPRLVALGGGKGGSGRTVIAATLGLQLAQIGKKAVVVDASLGAANLHSLFALERPPLGTADFLSGRVTQLDDILRPVAPFGASLQMIGGAPLAPAAAPRREAMVRFVERLRGLDVDFVIIDLDAGAASETLDFFLAADTRVMVLAPELTAIERHWQFVEAAVYRDAFGPGVPQDELAWSKRVFEMGRREGGGLPPPAELVEEIAAHDEAAASWLRRRLSRFRPYVLLNQARTTSDGRLLEGIRSVSRRRYAIHIESLGPVDFDDAVWLSVRRRRPLPLEYPDSAASRVLAAIARRLVATAASASRAAAEEAKVIPFGRG